MRFHSMMLPPSPYLTPQNAFGHDHNLTPGIPNKYSYDGNATPLASASGSSGFGSMESQLCYPPLNFVFLCFLPGTCDFCIVSATEFVLSWSTNYLKEVSRTDCHLRLRESKISWFSFQKSFRLWHRGDGTVFVETRNTFSVDYSGL